MAIPDVRERLNAKLDKMSDEEIAALLHYAEAMESITLPDDYNIENDPTVGMLSGPTDLARRAKEILRNDITARSGWTQKKDA